MARDLSRIREKAGKEPKACFTSIYHFVTDLGNLHTSYVEIEPGAAPGIDGVTKEAYGERSEPEVDRSGGAVSVSIVFDGSMGTILDGPTVH